MEGVAGKLDVGVKAEWDQLRTVVVHRPGIEMFLGLLEPCASLYERAFNRYEARGEHEQLVYILKHEFKLDVLHLKEAMLEAADRDQSIRESLVKMACGTIDFVGDDDEAYYARRQLEENTEVLGPGHFFNIMLLHPVVSLRTKKGERAINLNTIERGPLSNLYFMRDQQAITDRGVFLSRMAKPQRRRETLITGLFWQMLGVRVTFETCAPGTFEGGDFLPMKDFALVGMGDRTNLSGVEQLLKNGLGFEEVGVVHQPSHPMIPSGRKDAMIGMHLDAYFNVASSGVAVGFEPLLKAALVDVYSHEGEGVYRKSEKKTNLYDYIRKKGFEIINITALEQLAYASNFLCIKEGTILAVEVDRIVRSVIENLSLQALSDPERYGALLEYIKKEYSQLKDSAQFFPHKKEVYMNGIDAYPINLKNLTGGYGGTHCMTCPLRRG